MTNHINSFRQLPILLQAIGIGTMISYAVITPIVSDVATAGIILLVVLVGNYSLNNLSPKHLLHRAFTRGFRVPGTNYYCKNVMAFSGLMTAGVLAGASIHECLQNSFDDPNIFKFIASAGPWTIQSLAFYAYSISRDATLPNLVRILAKNLDYINGLYFTEICNICGGILLCIFGTLIEDPRAMLVGFAFSVGGCIAILKQMMSNPQLYDLI